MKYLRAALYTVSTPLLIVTLSGCGTVIGCSPSAVKAGYFCYKGHNFGLNVSPQYKEGTIDGCRTGEGYFRRDYALSKSSEAYRSGWDAGRAACPLVTPEEAKPGLRTQYQQAIDEKKQ